MGIGILLRRKIRAKEEDIFSILFDKNLLSAFFGSITDLNSAKAIACTSVFLYRMSKIVMIDYKFWDIPSFAKETEEIDFQLYIFIEHFSSKCYMKYNRSNICLEGVSKKGHLRGCMLLINKYGANVHFTDYSRLLKQNVPRTEDQKKTIQTFLNLENRPVRVTHNYRNNGEVIPLLYCARAKGIRAINYLIARDETKQTLLAQDEDGKTALATAVQWKRPVNIIKALLEADPEITQKMIALTYKDCQTSILHKVATQNSTYISKLIFDYVLDPKLFLIQDAEGNTPLHVASHKNTKLILERNKEALYIKNNDGETPLMLHLMRSTRNSYYRGFRARYRWFEKEHIKKIVFLIFSERGFDQIGLLIPLPTVKVFEIALETKEKCFQFLLDYFDQEKIEEFLTIYPEFKKQDEIQENAFIEVINARDENFSLVQNLVKLDLLEFKSKLKNFKKKELDESDVPFLFRFVFFSFSLMHADIIYQIEEKTLYLIQNFELKTDFCGTSITKFCKKFNPILTKCFEVEYLIKQLKKQQKIINNLQFKTKKKKN